MDLIAGLGLAAALAVSEAEERAGKCLAFRERLLAGLAPLRPILNGDQERALPHIVNLSFPGLDSEDVIPALAGLVAISNGSACASQSLTCSHVAPRDGVGNRRNGRRLRWSWCHMTEDPDWGRVVDMLKNMVDITSAIG